MPFTVIYRGSLDEYAGRIACATPVGDAGRYQLALWTDPAGLQAPATLHGVRPESIETGSVSVFPGATCRCGGEHRRDA